VSSTLQVYFFDTKGIKLSDDYLSYLSEKEIVFYKSITSEKRKKEFTLSRYILRHLLNVSSEIEFSKNTNGKLFIEGEKEFNISHSQGYIVCAVSDKCNVGIDIEADNKENSFLEISKKYYHEIENKYIRSFSEAKDQQQAFLKLWTLKESMFKLFGLGLKSENAKLYFDYLNNKIISYPGIEKLKKVTSVFIEYKNTYISTSFESKIEVSEIKFHELYIGGLAVEQCLVDNSNYKLTKLDK